LATIELFAAWPMSLCSLHHGNHEFNAIAWVTPILSIREKFYGTHQNQGIG